ncbi:MAG TPA: DUF433 domain-containing protein [Tepidisphaeraceae bacterium]|nr:DUF433 domain-containing protein [Tepidisphaeraceae bacterium]
MEDYFNFLAPDDIRIKGHRIGIESVLYEYIHRGKSPEEIVERFPTLSLEQVHATILYYLHNKDVIEKYVAQWLDDARHARERQSDERSPFLDRIRKLKAEQVAAHRGES